MLQILLSTYNGEKWLGELLTSIFNQTYTNWHLLIRDDGSTDRTKEIIQDWKKSYPDKITLFAEDNRGVIQSFNTLLAYSSAPYLALCDQDDVWKENKLEKLMEKAHLNGPLLIHHDLEVVDQNLKTTHRSFWRYQRINPKAKQLNRLLVQYGVTGCATMINKPLRNLAIPIPEGATMHDHWISLVAAAFGEIIAIDEPLILYRQHGQNQVGAAPYFSLKRLKRYQQSMEQIFWQAHLFLERYQLPQEQQNILNQFLQLPKLSWLKRLQTIIHNSFYKSGILRNLIFIFYR